MNFLQDRRVLLAGGAVLALAAGLGFAGLIVSRDHGSKAPPPASTGGLVLQMGKGESKLDPAKPLRCFVNGQFVGEATLAECAKRNGISTEALDVGVDQSGELAAGQGDAAITPLAPPDSSVPPVAVPTPNDDVIAPPPSRSSTGICWRYAASEWRHAADDLSLTGCVQLLFGGRCVPGGGAIYGRWVDQTLRLTSHRVEISGDNHSFKPLVEQAPGGCSIPSF